MPVETAPRVTSPGIKVVKDFIKSLNYEPDIAPTPSPEPKPTDPPNSPAPASTAATVPPPAVMEDDFEKVLSDTSIPRNKQNWDRRVEAEKKRLSKKDAEIAELQKQFKETQEKLASVKPGTVDTKEIESLKKERDELSERLRVTDIQNHPRFKAFYDGKVNAQIQLAQRIVGQDNAAQLAELLKLPDTAYRQDRIDELVSGLNPIQQSRIGAVLNSLSEIELEKQQQIDNAKSDYERLQAERLSKEQAKSKELAQTQEALFNETLASQTKNNFMFQKRDGQEDWNKGIDDRVAFAKGLLFSEKDPNKLATAAFYAASFPAVVESHIQANNRIAALEKQVSELTAAQPSIIPDSKETGSLVPKKPNKYMGGMEQAKGWIDQINKEPDPVE